jgi:glucose uptake protein GlcU
VLPPPAYLPCLAAGAIWSVGAMGNLLSTAGLGFGIGPVLSNEAGFCVNAAWSALVFHEIQGRRNIGLFLLATALLVCSAVLLSFARG